jgi:hypothetical protein
LIATTKRNLARVFLIIPIAFAITTLLAGAPADDQMMRDPGLLAGPWEGRSGDDLVGVYLKIITTLKGSAEYLTHLDVRVDRRIDMDWGWYEFDGRVAIWNGTRLKIGHSDQVTHKETNVDLVFDPKNEAWTGTFGPNQPVRLKRPGTSFQPLDMVGVSSNGSELAVWNSPFFGTWKPEVLGHTNIQAECLHVAVRRNASPVAWLDRADQFRTTYGELLTSPYITGNTISFGVDSPWANSRRAMYTGNLLNDQRIEGNWGRYADAHALIKAPPSSCASLSIEGFVSYTPFH